ncbi:MAG: hypothetical protein AB1538_15085 [Bacillota bacterium]
MVFLANPLAGVFAFSVGVFVDWEQLEEERKQQLAYQPYKPDKTNPGNSSL